MKIWNNGKIQPYINKNYGHTCRTVSYTHLDVYKRQGVERLEQFAAKFIAIHLQELYNDPEIKRAIVLSSQRISLRQETDTIELVDDIRYYLLRKYSFEPDDVELFENQDDLEYLKQVGYLEYRKDMEMVDNILADLELDV